MSNNSYSGSLSLIFLLVASMFGLCYWLVTNKIQLCDFQATVQPKKRGRPPSINPTEQTKKRKERRRKQRLRENTAGE